MPKLFLNVTAARACDARKPRCVKMTLSLTVKQSQSLSFSLACALSHTHKHKQICKHASTHADNHSQSLSLTHTHKPHTSTVTNSTVMQPSARGHSRRQIYHASWLWKGLPSCTPFCGHATAQSGVHVILLRLKISWAGGFTRAPRAVVMTTHLTGRRVDAQQRPALTARDCSLSLLCRVRSKKQEVFLKIYH